MKLGDKIAYAWVIGGNCIRHAGFIMGEDGDKFYLVGKGLKGYPYYGVWVEKSEIRPLSECEGFKRAFESHTERDKRKMTKTRRKKH